MKIKAEWLESWGVRVKQKQLQDTQFLLFEENSRQQGHEMIRKLRRRSLNDTTKTPPQLEGLSRMISRESRRGQQIIGNKWMRTRKMQVQISDDASRCNHY